MNESIRPKKSLGQHFLRDPRICRKIVDAMQPLRGDIVLEVGPGEGALTTFLAETECTLVLVEVDRRAVDAMVRRFGNRVEILHQDVLTIDPQIIARDHHAERLRVVGNIPYYITTPILFHFLDRRSAVQDLTVMMQREVGRRIAALHGCKEYGIISVLTQMHADIDELFDVQPGSFYPRPSVVSTVLRLRMRSLPRHGLTDEELFRTIVRTAFGKRRKTLRNSLRGIGDEALSLLGPDILARRPEQLSVEEFAALANTLAPVLAASRRHFPMRDSEVRPDA